jgi:hypothetical protein
LKLRIASLILVCLALVAIPAMADSYNNGPANGQVDAWTINFGFTVTDSFTFAGGGGGVTDVEFAAWLVPGDTISNVEVQIGSAAFGNDLFDGIVSLSQSNCSTNGFGYNVCEETGTFTGPTLGNGTYWLTLGNANVPSGDPVYWDENSGVGCTGAGCPSAAQENTVGTIPSEAFTLNAGTTTVTTTPEPSSIMLLGSGILGLAGILRRKLF